MKKILFLIFASLLVLGACANNDSSKKDNVSVDENKVQFTNNTLVLDQAVLKIKDAFLVNDKESTNGKKLLAFEYEVKSKDGNKDITPMNVWISSMNVFQDSENTESELEVGPTPNTGKFKSWDKHNTDVIKKGKVAKGIIAYELDNDKKVTLKATQGTEGKKLGSKTIDLSKLKTIDYSAAEDILNNTDSSNENSDDNTNNNIGNTSETDNDNSQDEVVNRDSSQIEQVHDNASQSNKNQQQKGIQQFNQQSDNQQYNGYMTPDEIDQWNKTKPTTHDESQMESVPQTHSGGHPSIFGTEKPPENNR